MPLLSIFSSFVRILCAALVGMAFEKYWFNKDLLLGYMWMINQFKLKEKQVMNEWQNINDRYNITWSTLTNTLIATVLFFLYEW